MVHILVDCILKYLLRYHNEIWASSMDVTNSFMMTCRLVCRGEWMTHVSKVSEGQKERKEPDEIVMEEAEWEPQSPLAFANRCVSRSRLP